jgi:hypothetical protein
MRTLEQFGAQMGLSGESIKQNNYLNVDCL